LYYVVYERSLKDPTLNSTLQSRFADIDSSQVKQRLENGFLFHQRDRSATGEAFYGSRQVRK